jgi:hypothetical protein
MKTHQNLFICIFLRAVQKFKGGGGRMWQDITVILISSDSLFL